ncbi:MAG: vanadium-dependent haloperoxidase, partial [Caldilineaceae bacterium]|nr:vanadium-dependent haloperoxidase [Caldilineaceae bacterium]
ATGQSLTQDFDASVPVAWAELAYRLVRDEKLTPPVTARLFAYSGVTLYEAVAPGMAGFQSLAGQLNELTPLPQPDSALEYHWPAVANAAMATLFRTLFAGGSGDTQWAIIDLERQLGDEFAASVSSEVLQRSVSQGQLVGLAIFEWAQADGYAYLSTCAYPLSGEVGHWLPTPPGYAPALLPCWGQMRSFVLRERSGECQPPVQPQYSEDVTSQFSLEALEVYQIVNNLNDEQMEIARFWADDPGKTGTPPGHSLAILTQVVKDQDLTLDQAAEAYARLGIALADSFISCWQTKFATDIVRPVTYIQQFIDPGWIPPVNTPPFPEYTSGHSVQTAAAAAVLGALFGDDYAFTDHTHDDLGYAPRSFASFSDLASEAAISRLYGGIHYNSAIEVGLQQGACIGQRVNTLRFRN